MTTAETTTAASRPFDCPVKPPVRAYRLTMALEADTRTDMAWALRNLAHRIEAEEVTVGVWGGPSDGAIYELLADPSVTHDSYHAALRTYLDDKRFNAELNGGVSRPT